MLLNHAHAGPDLVVPCQWIQLQFLLQRGLDLDVFIRVLPRFFARKNSFAPMREPG